MESNGEREENNLVEQGIIDVCNGLSDSLKWFGEVQKKVSDSVLKCVTKKGQSDINVLRKLLGLKFLETNEERGERLKKLERQRQLRIGKNEEKLFIAEIIKDEIKGKEEKYKKQILPILARICNFIERKGGVKKNDSWELNTGEKIDEAQIIKWTKLLLEDISTELFLELKPVFAEGRNEIAETITLEKKEIGEMVDQEINRLLSLSNHKGKNELYNEKKGRVINIIYDFIQKEEGIPIYTRKLEGGEFDKKNTLKEEQKRYHIIAWTQLLLKEEKTPLRIDNPFQTVYPAEPDYPIHFADKKLNDKTYKEIIEKMLVENIDDIISLFEDIAEEMLEILEKGNILEISNHSSWFNAPFIATMLINYCRAHPEQIFIVLGPALVTGEFGKAGPIKVANLLKTWPQTLNWANIGELKKLEKIVKKSFTENIGKYFLGKIIGNILLMFPSGTTDSFDEETNKIQLAPFSKGTKTLIRLILKNPQNFLHITAVNDRNTMPNPTKFVREKVYIKMLKEFLNSLDEKQREEVLNSFPEYVVGEGGKQVGTWLERDTEHMEFKQT